MQHGIRGERIFAPDTNYHWAGTGMDTEKLRHQYLQKIRKRILNAIPEEGASAAMLRNKVYGLSSKETILKHLRAAWKDGMVGYQIIKGTTVWRRLHHA